MACPSGRRSLANMSLAAIINLNHPASYAHAGFFQMSVPNLIVIGLMIVVFAAAIALPFPGSRRRRSDS
jgi:hypothetical protein